ncbi:MAG: hypothetical protein KFF77_00175, partial [Bacteroidetes bacterium]|nr:hypothetical protein [Bacteroidota bacterium]
MNATVPSPPPLPGLRVHIAVEDTTHCADDATFARDCRTQAETLPHAILLSGGAHECAARSVAALVPALLLEAKGRRLRLHTMRGTAEWEADPFDLLEQLMSAAQHASDGPSVPTAAGYVAYEAGRLIERLPGRTQDRMGLPDLLFIFPTRVRVHDRRTSMVTTYRLDWSDDKGLLT